MKYETVTIIFAFIEEDGKHNAILKRSNNTYVFVNKGGNKPYKVGETLKLLSETTNSWNWVNEKEYQRHRAIKEKRALQLQNVRELQKKIEHQKQQLLEQYRIRYLYHMTHIYNLDGILDNGLKSHNYARNNGLLQNDIANNEVNIRRARREPIYMRSIHDYVPFYFNPKNPMLFRRQNLQNEIVILAIDKMLIYNDNILFTDGNAASNPTSFYNNPQDLDKLNWNCIFADYWNDFEDGKRERCSEILIYPDVSIQSIKKIFCNNLSLLESVQQKIINHPSIEAKINISLYF